MPKTRRIRLALALLLAACTEPPPISTSDGRIIWSMTAAQDRIVAVGQINSGDGERWNTAVWSSADGEHWSLVFRGGFGAIESVAYGDGRWMAVGHATVTLEGGLRAPRDTLVTSLDGETWTQLDLPDEAAGAESIAFHQGSFVVVTTPTSAPNRIGRTTDGTDWEWVYQGESWWRAEIEANANGIVVAGDGPAIAFSADGHDFTAATAPLLTTVRDLSVHDDGFYVFGVQDCCFGEVPEAVDFLLLHSADGATFRDLGADPVPPTCEEPSSAWSWPAGDRGTLVELDGVYVDARCDGLRVSTDGGETWRLAELPPLDE